MDGDAADALKRQAKANLALPAPRSSKSGRVYRTSKLSGDAAYQVAAYHADSLFERSSLKRLALIGAEPHEAWSAAKNVTEPLERLSRSRTLVTWVEDVWTRALSEMGYHPLADIFDMEQGHLISYRDALASNPVVVAAYSDPQVSTDLDLEAPAKNKSAHDLAPKKFLPTVELVNFWRRGLEAHRAEARRTVRNDPHLRFLESQSTGDLRRAFAIRMKRLFSVVGNRHRYGMDDFEAVGAHGRFSLEMQYQILDRIQIRPDESTEFFSLLYTEMANYLSAGGKLGGSWGELVLRGGAIQLSPNKPEDDAGEWVTPEVLE